MRPPELVEREGLRSLGAGPGAGFVEIGFVVAFSLPALPDVRMLHHTVGNSYRNLLRTGFREAYVRKSYLSP